MRSARVIGAAAAGLVALAMTGCVERLPDELEAAATRTPSARASSPRSPAPARTSAAPAPSRTTAPPADPADALAECSAAMIKMQGSVPQAGANTHWSAQFAIQSIVEPACRIDRHFQLAVVNSSGGEEPATISYDGEPGRIVLAGMSQGAGGVGTAYVTVTWDSAQPGVACAQPVDLKKWLFTPPGGGSIEVESQHPPDAQPCGQRFGVGPTTG
jgi:hypothetical protein